MQSEDEKKNVTMVTTGVYKSDHFLHLNHVHSIIIIGATTKHHSSCKVSIDQNYCANRNKVTWKHICLRT